MAMGNKRWGNKKAHCALLANGRNRPQSPPGTADDLERIQWASPLTTNDYQNVGRGGVMVAK